MVLLIIMVAMAGGIWAYYISFVYPQFAGDPLVTIGMVLMVYLGGKGTVWGPILGAFILVPTQQYLAYRLGASEVRAGRLARLGRQRNPSSPYTAKEVDSAKVPSSNRGRPTHSSRIDGSGSRRSLMAPLAPPGGPPPTARFDHRATKHD